MRRQNPQHYHQNCAVIAANIRHSIVRRMYVSRVHTSPINSLLSGIQSENYNHQFNTEKIMQTILYRRTKTPGAIMALLLFIPKVGVLRKSIFLF